MKMNNVLIMVVIGALLYMEGYLLLAKGIVAISLIGAVTSAFKGRSKSKDKSKNKSPNMLDPIEIESVRKPPYRIPKNMDMEVSPDKDASESFVSEAMKASPLGITGKILGKKIKSD